MHQRFAQRHGVQRFPRRQPLLQRAVFNIGFIQSINDNSVASKAATQMTPPAILLKNFGSGSTASGNNAATIKKNISGFSHSPALRAASSKSRLMVAVTRLILCDSPAPAAAGYRYFPAHGGW